MKYLKKFSLFLEDIKPESSDPPDIVQTKNNMNKLAKNIKDFSQKKSQIEAIFNKVKTREEMTATADQIKKILGPDKGPDKEGNNLVLKFIDGLRSEKEIGLSEQEIIDDKTNLSDLKVGISSLADPKAQKSNQDKVKNLELKIKEKNKLVSDRAKDFLQDKKGGDIVKIVQDEQKKLKTYVDKINKFKKFFNIAKGLVGK